MTVGFRENKMWWWVATYLGVAAITFAIGVTVNFAWTTLNTHPLEVNYANAELGTLRTRILEAKASGNSTLQLGVLACGWDIGSLKEALSRDTVVVADLVGKKTYEDTDGLITWYRFKTRETLLQHPNPRHAYFFESAPADMLPIAEDEFLIHEINGQMEIDGVTVTQHSNGAEYLEGQTYLLFLWMDPSKRTAMRTATDPLGVFLIDSNGNLSSYVKRPYPLKTTLAKRFNNSLKDLRRVTKK